MATFVVLHAFIGRKYKSRRLEAPACLILFLNVTTTQKFLKNVEETVTKIFKNTPSFIFIYEYYYKS